MAKQSRRENLAPSVLQYVWFVGLPSCGLSARVEHRFDPLLGELLATRYYVGVDAMQDRETVSHPLGDLRGIYA